MFNIGLRSLRVLVAALSVMVLAFALITDVTQAQKACNIPHDCSTDCGAIFGWYGRIEQTNQRYKTGNLTLRCGVMRRYEDPACKQLKADLGPVNATNVCR